MNYKLPIEEGMKGKVAIITGGTSGIGQACVKTFCEAGVNVVTIGRRAENGTALVEEINARGKGECTYIKCDVTKPEEIQHVVEETAKKYGRIDTLLNCAGYFPKQHPIDDETCEEFENVINTNLRAYVLFSKYAMPYLRTNKGSVINIGSITAHVGCQGSFDSLCTKGAIEAFTRGLAFDEAFNGVRVNEIKPGAIASEISAKLYEHDPEYADYMQHVQILGRQGRAEEIGYAALFLASDWASFITGIEMLVSGGYEMGESYRQLCPYTPWPEPVKK